MTVQIIGSNTALSTTHCDHQIRELGLQSSPESSFQRLREPSKLQSCGKDRANLTASYRIRPEHELPETLQCLDACVASFSFNSSNTLVSVTFMSMKALMNTTASK